MSRRKIQNLYFRFLSFGYFRCYCQNQFEADLVWFDGVKVLPLVCIQGNYTLLEHIFLRLPQYLLNHIQQNSKCKEWYSNSVINSIRDQTGEYGANTKKSLNGQSVSPGEENAPEEPKSRNDPSEATEVQDDPVEPKNPLDEEITCKNCGEICKRNTLLAHLQRLVLGSVVLICSSLLVSSECCSNSQFT